MRLNALLFHQTNQNMSRTYTIHS